MGFETNMTPIRAQMNLGHTFRNLKVDAVFKVESFDRPTRSRQVIQSVRRENLCWGRRIAARPGPAWSRLAAGRRPQAAGLPIRSTTGSSPQGLGSGSTLASIRGRLREPRPEIRGDFISLICQLNVPRVKCENIGKYKAHYTIRKSRSKTTFSLTNILFCNEHCRSY